MGLSEQDRLKKIDERMSQLKAQKQAILNREKEKERKERTRRLIQNGALAEQYLQCNNLDTLSFEAFLSLLTKVPNFQDIILKCKEEINNERQYLEQNKQALVKEDHKATEN